MKKYTILYTGDDNLSHFKDEDFKIQSTQPLGMYTEKIPVENMMFRFFDKDAVYDWHNAPNPQYIIYLEGSVEVEASNGKKRTFTSGDVLFANDLTGKGHITRTLSSGKSIIVIKRDTTQSGSIS